MMNPQRELSSPDKIRENLHSALGKIGTFEQCTLLDYPDYFNIGDHLIGLATIFYLTDVLKAKINYVASLNNFSEEVMEKQAGNAPIILQGGGNLGDTWSHHQEFRERIISKYCDRPIIIMPQCIYFKNPEKLNQAAAIFNAHPNLTLFARDNTSYEIACKHFYNCQVIKAPDTVFHLVDMPLPCFTFNPKRPILYLSREDSELNQSLSPITLDIPNLVVQEWITSQWIYRGTEQFRELKAWYWRLPGMVLLVREGWHRGFSNPKRWISQQQWERSHPYVDKLNTLPNSAMLNLSWKMMHAGIYQLLQSRLVITNRLHGHLLCILLKIPHIFLPNAYYKNEAFYETWTSQIPYCRFIKNSSDIKPAIQELLSSYS